ncbi:MAG: lamin tail domain-containing protein [Anaerolineae bacterium]
MPKNKLWLCLLLLALILAACGSETPTPAPAPTAASSQPGPTPTPAPPASPSPVAGAAGVLISEVLPGIHGVNNNLEFVELYNAGGDVVDLDGWSLWYRLSDGRDEALVYRWQAPADLPGHGHYLLARAGQDLGLPADVTFETSLFELKGGLALRDAAGETVDTLAWGDGPESYRSGNPAPAPEGGASLERLPGGAAGNGRNSGDHAADFYLLDPPDPQNSGDPPAPLPDARLSLRLDLPASLAPGAEVTYAATVENHTGAAVHELRARLPVPPDFEILDLPGGVDREGDWLTWRLDELPAGAAETLSIAMQAPWTYVTTVLGGAYVEAEDGPARAYGPLLPLAVEGGAIPIGAARTLEGQTVTVEGVATMYSGGFFAGTTGTKFYLEDKSGGIQVYCPGGQGLVEVAVGDRVRVTGGIEVYRDSLELVPGTLPDDVEVLGDAPPPDPAAASLAAAGSDEALLGRLVQVEGTAVRIDEFTYSYEVDLADDAGSLALVYVEKDAGLTAEPLALGNDYRVTGILELYDGQWQLKPRFQDDMARIYPPELMLEVNLANSVQPGGVLTYTLTAYNHTTNPLDGVELDLLLPEGDTSLLAVLDGGQALDGAVAWDLGTLAPEGGSAAVRALLQVADDAGGEIVSPGALVTAEQWPDPVQTGPLHTFVGWGVPIWAIQGPADRSPYTGQDAATEGIVTGVFPDLEGFWIQETTTDDDPATSAGLFVLATGDALASLPEPGDRVRLSGRVREVSGQTLLYLVSPDDLERVARDQDLPGAVALDPPLDAGEAAAYYEALEGMLVQVAEPALAVGPTTKYGETALVHSHWGVERIMRGDPTGLLLFVDDGSSTTHLDGSTLPFALASGDTLTEVVGPLAYTYENFKIEPIAPPTVGHVEASPPALAPAGPAEFSVATFNVENLFDAAEPNPSDPPLPSRSQYALDLFKTAGTIVAMGAPDVVGLQEVENVGILEDLAGQEALAAYDYQPFLVEGSDSRGIDVGYLVRGDRATVEGAVAFPAPEGLTSRPPLLITVTLHLSPGDLTVYLLNNHFTSMSGGEKPTEPRRMAQAAWNVTLAEEILARDPEAHVVVLGDLNSFYDSPPLDVLREAGLRHVYEFVAPLRPYSYVYQGVSETLDHLLVTPSLYEHLVRVEVLHVNADYPLPLPDDDSIHGTSDHDPLLAVFAFE